MRSEDIKRLVAEMAESRVLHGDTLKRVQRSVATFKNSLTAVQRNLQTTAQRFSELVQEPGKVRQDAPIIEMYRRAS